MRKAETVVLGCAGTLLMACLATLALVAFTDFAPRFIQNRVRLASQARAIERLSSDFPFTPPAGGGVAEPRLVAFLEASCAARKAAINLDAWDKAHGEDHRRREGVFRGGGPDLAADFLASLEKGLRAQKMDLDEFFWIGDRMGVVAAGPPPADRLARSRAQAAELKSLADDSRTRPKERRAILQTLEAMSLAGQLWSAADEADYQLYLRYADRIEACRLSGPALDILDHAVVADPGRKRQRVIVEDGSEPAPQPGQTSPES